MRYVYCALVVMLTALPASMVGAQPTNQELQKRIDSLKFRIQQLERREKQETRAENKGAAKAKGSSASKKEPTTADWAKVYVGMPDQQAKSILGEPKRTRSTGQHQIWSFHDQSVKGGEVWFKDGVVDRVNPPYRQ